MDVLKESNKDLELIDIASPQEDFVDSENNCCLCGTELVFNYAKDMIQLSIQEEANCPSCQIQTKNKEHRLH